MRQSPQGRIVVLASKRDPHVALAGKYLREAPIIIDFGDLDAGLTYRLLPESVGLEVAYNGRLLDLGPGAVKSVWNRRTDIRWLDTELRVDPPEEYDYALTSLQNNADVLKTLFDPHVFWVSDYRAIIRANQKPLQLVEARRAGFNVPATLFTSDALAARAFVERYERCVIKTLASSMPPGRLQYSVIRRGTELDFEGLNIAPQIFQELITPSQEVRAAVIGNEVFASVVADTEGRTPATHGTRDFRRAFLTGTFAAHATTLPAGIARSCIRYVRQLGLACGYFDLMCDTRGKWWFIECNANGQWGFVDMPTVDRIAEALAHLLEAGAPAG